MIRVLLKVFQEVQELEVQGYRKAGRWLLVKCLLYKHEDLPPCEKQGVAAGTYNSSSREMGTDS